MLKGGIIYSKIGKHNFILWYWKRLSAKFGWLFKQLETVIYYIKIIDEKCCYKKFNKSGLIKTKVFTSF